MLEVIQLQPSLQLLSVRRMTAITFPGKDRSDLLFKKLQLLRRSEAYREEAEDSKGWGEKSHRSSRDYERSP